MDSVILPGYVGELARRREVGVRVRSGAKVKEMVGQYLLDE